MSEVAAAYYLGLDGGGTATRARLVTVDGRVLGEGVSGPSNLGLGAQTAGIAIEQAIDQAYTQAGLSSGLRADTVAGFGFASADIEGLPGVDVEGLGFRSVEITSDAIAACLGAHGGGDGAILIVGTGSQGVAMVDGKTTTLGGWGFHLGDQASGSILGRAAIRASVLAHEALGPRSALTDRVMASFEHDLNAAYIWALTATPSDYAAWAPQIFEDARNGDPVATPILQDGVGWVEALAGALIDLGARRICLMGGLAGVYADRISPRLKQRLGVPRGDAMDGAILLARQSARLG